MEGEEDGDGEEEEEEGGEGMSTTGKKGGYRPSSKDSYAVEVGTRGKKESTKKKNQRKRRLNKSDLSKDQHPLYKTCQHKLWYFFGLFKDAVPSPIALSRAIKEYWDRTIQEADISATDGRKEIPTDSYLRDINHKKNEQVLQLVSFSNFSRLWISLIFAVTPAIQERSIANGELYCCLGHREV